jgi:hypothetical protein
MGRSRLRSTFERALEPPGILLLGAADALCGGAGRLRAPAATSVPGPSVRRSRRLPRNPSARRPRPPVRVDELAALLDVATVGHAKEVADQASRLLARDPLNAVAYFLRGLAELETGDAEAAVGIIGSAGAGAGDASSAAATGRRGARR